MSRTKLFRAVLFAACAWCGLGAANGAFAQSCTPPGLPAGWYSFLIQGYTPQSASPATAGKYLSGAAYFNPPNCQFIGYNSFGGTAGAFANAQPSGTFTANADGTVSISLSIAGQSGTQPFVGSISKTTGGIVGIETDATAVTTIDIEPMGSSVAYPNGANSSLSGTYSVTCTGTGGSDGQLADLNRVTFDGKGNISGIDSFNNNGQFSTANIPYTGTYTVYPDGTFQGSFTGQFTGTTFSGVISNSGAVVQYSYQLAGTGGDLGCTGRK